VGRRTYLRGDYAHLSQSRINELRVGWFHYVDEPTPLEREKAKRAAKQRDAQMSPKNRNKTDPVTGQQWRKHD
jgi:hypothetical protein